MALQDLAVAFVFIRMCVGQTHECSLKNTTCGEIKDVGGWKFIHDCPLGSKIFIYNTNETLLGWLGGLSSEYSSEVLKIDNHSVLMRVCQYIRVQCIYTNEKGFANEKCVKFEIMENPGTSDDPTKKEVIWAAVMGCLLICIVALCAAFVSWRRTLKNQNQKATVSGFLRHLLTCRWLVGRSDVEPRGGGENDIEQGTTLESVSGDVSDPSVSSPFNDGDTDRSLNDDPGGMNGTQTNSAIRDVDISRAACDQTEEQELEGRPLLSDERAANRGINMTGEAIVLVDKRGFYPNQDNVSSAAPVQHVESEFKEEE